MKKIEERVAELTYEYGTNTDLDGSKYNEAKFWRPINLN